MQGISLASWLQITGPTFATLVVGFTLLWNAQQATTGSLLEVGRSVGRLEGSIGALVARIERLDTRLQGLDARLEQLADAVNTLAKRLGPS
jgi:hypothetical protein